VIAAAGKPIRELATELSSELQLPPGFQDPRVCQAGILAVRGPAYAPDDAGTDSSAETFCSGCRAVDRLQSFPLVVVVDDSDFVAESLSNFLWVVFTRSNPAVDVYGIDSFIEDKHWGCRGSLVIDARIKPHHAPPLEEDPEITRKVDARAARGGPLAEYL
jgi:4-hydroxy-3-polyprenylbenzoate decarboxylase